MLLSKASVDKQTDTFENVFDMKRIEEDNESSKIPQDRAACYTF